MGPPLHTETKEQSKQWTEKGESAPKKAKTWPENNGEYYANLLQRLGDEIKEKRPHLAKKKMLFHQDNALVHTSIIAMAKINE